MAPNSAPSELNSTNHHTPVRMSFLEELDNLFNNIFPDLWKLGQAYFTGELYVRVDPSKPDEFKVNTELLLNERKINLNFKIK